MVGGFAGVACSIAALIFKVPVVVVNVDSRAGRANRLVGRFAKASAVASSTSGLPRAVLTGAPVRDAVLGVDRSANGRGRAKALLDIAPTLRVLAVVGGSLGARTLNSLAVQLRSSLKDASGLLIYHVCGARNADEVRAELARTQRDAALAAYRLVPYETHLPELFAAADLVITRAGAMTVAELEVIGVPSILIPLPFAPGDHQTVNARALEQVGAALVISDEDATSAHMSEVVGELLADQARLVEMGAKALTLARPNAAMAIAELVNTTMESGRSQGRRGGR